MSEGEYPGAESPEILLRVLLALVDKMDHIHADLVALRARADVPRPECYPRAAVAGDVAPPREPERE